MVKAILTKRDGGRVLVFGLEEENVSRIKRGFPVHVFLAELGYGGPRDEVIIMYGSDAQAIAAELRAGGLDIPPFETPAKPKREEES